VSDMSIQLSIPQTIKCEDVIQIAEKAADAILAVYDSKVSLCLGCWAVSAFD